VLAPSQAEGRARAQAAAEVALADQGLDLARGRLRLSCDPAPADCLSPGSVVHVDLTFPVPLPLVPTALGGHTPSIRVEAEHDTPYGTFREHRS
jgi:hypothetical protein